MVHASNPIVVVIPLHQSLIFHLYQFHLALCPPKPIRAYLIEDVQDDYPSENAMLLVKVGASPSKVDVGRSPMKSSLVQEHLETHVFICNKVFLTNAFFIFSV